MPQAFHIVDAFTAEPLTGNPAAVYLLQRWRDDSWLSRVAREMNQSETAFLVQRGDNFELRWFTPTVEVDLCGHATLASAHMLWSIGAANSDKPILFSTRSGMLTAAKSDDRIELDFPLLSEEAAEAPPGLIESLGVTPLYVGKSRHDFVVA